MEILDIYDSNGNPTGKKITRGKDKLNENEFIKLVVVWIEDNGKYLIQKTSKEKDSVYAITGGHLTSGNSETEQIVIEVREELGVDIDEKELKLLGNIILKNAIFEVYLCKNQINKNTKFTLQKEEVEDVFWMNKVEIEDLIKKGVFRKSSKEHYEKFIK